MSPEGSILQIPYFLSRGHLEDINDLGTGLSSGPPRSLLTLSCSLGGLEQARSWNTYHFQRTQTLVIDLADSGRGIGGLVKETREGGEADKGFLSRAPSQNSEKQQNSLPPTPPPPAESWLGSSFIQSTDSSFPAPAICQALGWAAGVWFTGRLGHREHKSPALR